MIFSRISIKHQLLLIVAIITFPAILIILNSGFQQRSNNIHDAKAETQKLAEAIVSEQKNLATSTRQLFIALSQLSSIKRHEQLVTQAILAEILRLSPQYSNIFVADPSGSVWASAVPLTEVVSVADRRYFKNALASGKISSGDYHIARTSKKPTLNLAYPLLDGNGQVTDVIVAGLSFSYYRQVFESFKMPEGASFALLDYKGIVLARAIEPEKYVGTPANPEVFQSMLEGPDEETAIGTSSIVGDRRIQTYRKIRLEGESVPYMYVRVGIPAKTIMATSDANLYKNLSIYSVSVLAAFLLSWLAGKTFITDRIVVLQRSSQRLADGDLQARVADTVGGGEIGELGRAFDNMAEKLAAREKALRASERSYRDIFNTTHDALFVNDEHGGITEVNRSAEAMFGYTRDELLATSIKELISGEPPYSFQEALSLIRQALDEGTQEFEWRCKKKSGDLFWTEIAVTPTSSEGRVQVLAVIRDITERKEMESMKEALLSNISHEMRTPLASMLGFLEFVIENRLDDDQLNDYHVTMHREAERLNEMITNFLDMQRLKSKLHKHEFMPLDVKDLLDDVTAIFASPCAKHTITVGACPDLPPILGDEELLHQALSNLLSNAIKYSPEGGKVTLDARLDDDMVTLSIKDEGTGIPQDSLDKIYDIFYRVESPSRRQVPGTGLGLALVKGVAEAHRGKVWADSRVGQGSTFYLSLPVAAGDRVRTA